MSTPSTRTSHQHISASAEDDDLVDDEMDDGFEATPVNAGMKRARDETIDQHLVAKRQRSSESVKTEPPPCTSAGQAPVPDNTVESRVYIPIESPPYETPLDLRYPLHWYSPRWHDGRDFKDTFTDIVTGCICGYHYLNCCSCSAVSQALQMARNTLWKDGRWLGQLRLSIGTAKVALYQPVSPPYIQVSIESAGSFPRWENVHETVMRTIAENFVGNQMKEYRNMPVRYCVYEEPEVPESDEEMANFPPFNNLNNFTNSSSTQFRTYSTSTPGKTTLEEIYDDDMTSGYYHETTPEPEAPAGTRITNAIIPIDTDSPPYESPIDLRCPLHFDNHAQFRETLDRQYPPSCYSRDEDLALTPEQAFGAAHDAIDKHWNGIVFLEFGVASKVAHNPGKRSPGYFRVKMMEPEVSQADWKNVHETVIAAVKMHFGHLEEYRNAPIRYMTKEWDEDLGIGLFD